MMGARSGDRGERQPRGILAFERPTLHNVHYRPTGKLGGFGVPRLYIRAALTVVESLMEALAVVFTVRVTDLRKVHPRPST